MAEQKTAEQNPHSRMISEKFLNDLKSGILQPVTEMVKNDPNRLFLAFRHGYINIYYRGNNLFKIEEQQTSYKCTFDFNHSRYTEESVCRSYQQTLRDLGMTWNNQNMLAWKIQERKPLEQWETAKRILMSLIDDHHNNEKKWDFIKEKSGQKQSKTKKSILERQDEQELALKNHTGKDGFFLYDIEYEEPSKEQVPGCYDILALKVECGQAVELWILELKSKPEACEGAHGIQAHSHDMSTYLEREDLKDARRKDAKAITAAYHALLGWPDIAFKSGDIPVEYGFVLIHDARSYTKTQGYHVFIADDDFVIHVSSEPTP